MPSIYLRPTADNFVTHTMYPEGSTSGYTLIDDIESDGSSTYIGTIIETADVRVTKTSSFIFAGVDAPTLEEYQITSIRIGGVGDFPLTGGSNEFLMSFQVTSNGITGISDIIKMSSTSTGISDYSFDRNNDFIRMFKEYALINGKFPDVEITVTTHCKSSKTSSSSFFITQLYLQVNYNTGIYSKSLQLFGPELVWSAANRIYKKINGVWEVINNGTAQIQSQLNKKGGHRLIKLASKSATCTATGLTEGCRCNDCFTIFKEQEIIPMINHTPTTVEASEATCVADGYTGGERCSVCNAVISGSVIPATGNHTPVDAAKK